MDDADYLDPQIIVKHQKGDYNLENYQVTRSQYVPTTNKISVHMKADGLKFSANAIAELADVMYVELLYHPLFQLLVVRKSDKNNRHAVKWSEYTGEKYRPKKINGKAFMPVLFSLCEWNMEHKYVLTGYAKEQNGEKALMFYVDEPEIRIVKEGKHYTAYPKRWKNTIGDKYLEHEAKTVSIFSPEIEWNLGKEGVIANKPKFRIRKEKELRAEMQEIIEHFEKQIKEWVDDGE